MSATPAGPARPQPRRSGWLALPVAAACCAAPGALAAGVVTNATTTALLQALRDGGLVQLAFNDTLALETPLIIGTDTILDGEATGGRTATLSGADTLRLLRVLPGVRLELRDLVLRGGLSDSGSIVFNEGILLASNVTFTSSVAQGANGAAGANGENRVGIGGNGGDGGAGGNAAGGAVYNLGEARFVGCLFSFNRAVGGNGGKGGDRGTGTWKHGTSGEGGDGAPAWGGAIASQGPLQIQGCTFTSNSAEGGDGGAGGTESAIIGAGQGGRAGWGAGGAIYSEGHTFIQQSSFATNLATGGTSAAAGAPFGNIGNRGEDGGDAFGGAATLLSGGVVVNSTFFTNLVAGGNGSRGAAGGFVAGDGGDGGDALGAALHVRGEFALTNLTFFANSGTNGAPGAAGNGNFSDDGSPGRLGGSALSAEDSPGPLVVNSILSSRDFGTIHGPVRDGGYNLFSDGGTGQPGTGSVLRATIALSEFRVWTQGPPGLLPVTGSLAVDAARTEWAPVVDQRGIGRPMGRAADAGAMESVASSFRLGGQVLNGTSGVDGVTLLAGAYEAVTDRTGRFDFGVVPGGFYTVGFAEGGTGYVPQVIQLALSADTTNLVFRTAGVTVTSQRENGGAVIVVTVNGTAGTTYQLEGSDALTAWTRLDEKLADAAGRAEFRQPTTQGGQRYYRVRAQ